MADMTYSSYIEIPKDYKERIADYMREFLEWVGMDIDIRGNHIHVWRGTFLAPYPIDVSIYCDGVLLNNAYFD